jgi:hypothetical protein
VSLTDQKSLQGVQNLPFCYLCGRDFEADDSTDMDHVPPENAFAKEDRQPLLLKTHVACNHRHSKTDQKIGQLIGMQLGRVPSDPKNRVLKLHRSNQIGATALSNLDIDGAIWRWVSGFHAALYREPLTKFGLGRTLVSPFVRANLVNGVWVAVPVLPQHLVFVETIKQHRVRGTLDSIQTNKGNLVYECVWAQSDHDGWFCMFALNIYDWKDLGATPISPPRGCAGAYVMEAGQVSTSATRVSASALFVPNYDPLDPFAR